VISVAHLAKNFPSPGFIFERRMIRQRILLAKNTPSEESSWNYPAKNHPSDECSGEEFSASGEFVFERRFPGEEIS
jgi:hypothetical protein